MRADFDLETFRSAGVYGHADLTSVNVRGGGDMSEYFTDLFESPGKLFKPHKDTLLHEAARGIDAFYTEYWVHKVPDETAESYVSELDSLGISVPGWLRAGEDVYEHRGEIVKLMGQAFEKQLPSVFHLLFSDRDFLTAFGGHVADYISTLDPLEYPQLDGGRVPRLRRLPAWLKRAIFYRDRGRCQHCWKDLSGLAQPINDLQLDHIIPLAIGGSNDPTNFQLACATCNQKKGKQLINSQPRFAPYW